MKLGLVIQAMHPLGCVCRETLGWLAKYDDFELAWNECENAHWLAFFLVRIGFDPDRVTQVVMVPAAEVPWIHNKLEIEVARSRSYGTPEALATGAYTLVVHFCRYTDIPMSDLADTYRSEFSFQEIIEKLDVTLSLAPIGAL